MRSILVLLLVAHVAHADRPKYTREQHLKLDVPHTERAKTRTTAPAEEPRRPITADEAFVIEERTEPIRQAQEGLLLQLVRDSPDEDPDKPEYFFQLAELYARQERLWRLRANAPH